VERSARAAQSANLNGVSSANTASPIASSASGSDSTNTNGRADAHVSARRGKTASVHANGAVSAEASGQTD
jgi:hypothetical protein